MTTDVRDYQRIYSEVVDLHDEWGSSEMTAETWGQLWRRLGRILAGEGVRS